MIALYIFDMGGVVSLGTDLSVQIGERLGLNERQIHDIARPEFDKLVRGELSVPEFWSRASELTGRLVEEDLWTTLFRPLPNPPVIQLVKELKGRARVVAGTNTIAPHYRIHEQAGDYAIFDAVYASHLMGLAKPDPAFYEHILRAEGCRAAQAVFVDDVEGNVEAARGLGIRAFLFRSAEELTGQLARLERDPPPG